MRRTQYHAPRGETGVRAFPFSESGLGRGASCECGGETDIAFCSRVGGLVRGGGIGMGIRFDGGGDGASVSEGAGMGLVDSISVGSGGGVRGTKSGGN